MIKTWGFIFFAVFSSALAAQPPGPGAPREDAWYESNSIGFPVRRLEADETAGTDYVLHTWKEGLREFRRLFDADKKEVRRWERLLTETGVLEEESVFIDGVRDSLTLYEPSGRVKEEAVFSGGKEDGRFLFTYPESSGETPAPDGSAKISPLTVSFTRSEGGGFRDEYRYLPSGDFRGVTRVYDDGAQYSSVFNSNKGILVSEWHSFGGLEIQFHYTAQGLLHYTEEYRGGVLVERSSFRYDTQTPPRLKEKTTWVIAEGREIRLEYGEDGNPRRESVFESGTRVALTLFTYEDNLMRRKEKRERHSREEWEYFYDEEKKLARENYSRGGKLEKILYYDPEPDYNRIDEYYTNGELFLRLYFTDGEEVKRDIIMGDEN